MGTTIDYLSMQLTLIKFNNDTKDYFYYPNSGHYMMAESSWYHDDDHLIEEISTPVFAKTGKRCRMRFWHVMDLGQNGSMVVTMKSDKGSVVRMKTYKGPNSKLVYLMYILVQICQFRNCFLIFKIFLKM